jgi:hypothetical protein
MIRSVEVLLVIIILAGAFVATTYFAVLPSPREVSPMNLRRLSYTTLQMLDSDFDLSRAAFINETDPDYYSVWGNLQVALSAVLPPNMLYNLTVYDVNTENGQLYSYIKSVSNAENLGVASDVSTYTVASSNVTFNVNPQKIGGANGGTLYIMNCTDANGWWITGYTAQSLANDLYTMLSPYFDTTLDINSTAMLGRLLGGQSLKGEAFQNAVIINTCGETVPIPSAYCTSPYSDNSYARYSYFVGQKVNAYNWTWASIVGYPFYYVSNTASFSSGQNGYGIFGMQQTGGGGSIAFLRGLDGQGYGVTGTAVTDSQNRVATLTQSAIDACNYYGIYPSSSQTSTRALTNTILQTYNLKIALNIFNPVGTYNPGAIYNHVAAGSTSITGSFLALGLTRTPDVRITGIGLLSYYNPTLYSQPYSAHGTSRLIVLQLGLMGGS